MNSFSIPHPNLGVIIQYSAESITSKERALWKFILGPIEPDLRKYSVYTGLLRTVFDKFVFDVFNDFWPKKLHKKGILDI